jgi:lipopolysaccharide export system protein LptA
MKALRSLLTAGLAASVLTLAAHAADLTGDWKWSSQSSTGVVQMTAKIVQQDATLTGTVTGRQGPADITAGTLKDGVVTFSVSRSSGGKTMVIGYEGKVEGDTITGSIIRPGVNGAAPTKTEWKASRGKP